MTPKSELIALAERMDALGSDLVCPLCGDNDFDAPGLACHIKRWCEVADASEFAHDNVETASVLRHRARSEAL